jgi:cytochrome b6-f complex iron-sulfur subunit
MSNYHVEPADRPQALTSQALKARRHEQVQGMSRRQLLRTSLGAGMALWLLEVTAGTIGFLWPTIAEGAFGGDVPIGSLDDLKLQQAALPIDEGFPAYVADARAFIMLVNPSRQEFVPGTDDEGDGTALNVRALYQRCPHLGCKPNPCERNFWIECPCHASRFDRLGIKIAGAAFGPAPRSMDRFAITVDGDRSLTVHTARITLGPLPVALGQPGVIPPRTPTGCI